MTNNHNEFNINQIAEIELIYRTNVPASKRPKITGSADAYELLRLIWDDYNIELQEEFKMLLLNRNNRVLGKVDIGKGGVSGVTVDMKRIFAAAISKGLKGNCSGIIVPIITPQAT